MSGPQWRCDGATDDELIGLLTRWAAVESSAAAGNSASPASCCAAALALSLPGADKLANLAWALQARLPGIGAKLADGTITLSRMACWTAKRRCSRSRFSAIHSSCSRCQTG